jgi:hypothetical protein
MTYFVLFHRNGRPRKPAGGKLDLTDTIKDGARVVATDAALRQQLLMAFTEDSRLHIREVFWNFGIHFYMLEFILYSFIYLFLCTSHFHV